MNRVFGVSWFVILSFAALGALADDPAAKCLDGSPVALNGVTGKPEGTLTFEPATWAIIRLSS